MMPKHFMYLMRAQKGTTAASSDAVAKQVDSKVELSQTNQMEKSIDVISAPVFEVLSDSSVPLAAMHSEQSSNTVPDALNHEILAETSSKSAWKSLDPLPSGALTSVELAIAEAEKSVNYYNF